MGALPLIARQHREAQIFATPTTKKLTALLLGDMLRFTIQKQEFPLFTPADLEQTLERMEPVEFGDWFSPWPKWQICLEPAGHIPGAATIIIKIPRQTLVISGDISFSDDGVVKGAKLTEGIRPQTLVVTATNTHLVLPERRLEEQRLKEKVGEVLGRGGHVLIPAMAVGRAPQIALCLAQAGFQVNLGGLAIPVFELYGLPKENVRFVGAGGGFKNEVRRIAASEKPEIVVATSGMLDSGLSRELAFHWIGEPKNAILIPGFQAEESLGRRMLRLRRFGELSFPEQSATRRVMAEVEVFSLSGHADGPQIANYIAALSPHNAILVHGSQKSFDGLLGFLHKTGFRGGRIRIGHNHEKVRC